MKQFIPVIFPIIFLSLFFSCKKNTDVNTLPPTNTDSFTVTVTNGYGSGKYKIGDTVHIFTSHYTANQLFDKWSGDISLLNAPDEWHTWFVMPNKNITVTGSIKNISNFALQYEQIKGRDRLKPVYYYFPAGHKGIVYLLHGTSGTAANLVGDYEWQQLIKDLVTDNFAVIVTEAEEATTKVDANADGKLRWTLLPVDTIRNIDFANIRIITDTFYHRGLTDRSKPKYSIGMSDGGFFSAGLSYIYNFKSGVQYCAQGSANLMQGTSIPTQFCMARNDDAQEVGIQGDADALSYSNSMKARGVCSKYYINERSPIYPERFARSGDISTTQSTAIFNELQSKGYIDSKNYFKGISDSLISDIQNNPVNFPVIRSLTLNQIQFMIEQIKISAANHHIYSDYNRATLRFLDTQCQ
ncbi:MAG: hypothetical protein M3R50_08970 [Bacteroidota bacterium]|nr:hypothetical protein [Bacteroidota bacterium]